MFARCLLDRVSRILRIGFNTVSAWFNKKITRSKIYQLNILILYFSR